MPNRLRLLILGLASVGLSTATAATTVTLELPNGAAYAVELRSMEPTAGAEPQLYVPFSGLEYILRQLDPNAQSAWDARTGLLQLAVGGQRFSYSLARPLLIINDKKVPVAYPIRFTEGEKWLPLEAFRLTLAAIGRIRLLHDTIPVSVGTDATTAPIVQSPDEVLRDGLLPGGAKTPAGDFPASAPLVNLPPVAARPPWRVVFDPVWVEEAESVGAGGSALRAVLAQIAERCATLVREEGSMDALVLTEHDAATSPDLILQWLSKESPDVIVFVRLETSPLRAAPGCTVLFMEESVDSRFLLDPSDEASTIAAPSRALGYVPFQSGNRRLAERIAAALAEVPVFRDRLIVPAPLFLLKRCRARAVMLLFAFPERSSELTQLAEGGVREEIARRLADALISYYRDRGAPFVQPAVAGAQP